MGVKERERGVEGERGGVERRGGRGVYEGVLYKRVCYVSGCVI